MSKISLSKNNFTLRFCEKIRGDLMKVTAKTDPHTICENWGKQINLANSLSVAIKEGAEKRLSISQFLDELEKKRKKLKKIHRAALERARYESEGWGRIRRICYTAGGTVLDGAFQAVTAILWAEALSEANLSSKDSIVIASATLASAVASNIKDRIWSSNKKYLKEISQMEEIIPNKLILKHYKVMITKYKLIEAEYKSTAAEYKSTADELCSVSAGSGVEKIKEKTSVGTGKKMFISAINKVLDKNAKVKLHEKYVVKLCGLYPRIRTEGVLELTEKFKRLKQIMVMEENLVQEEIEKNSNADVMAIMDQLSEQVTQMQEIIAEADDLLKLQADLKNTRSKYVASKFRLTVQFLLELGSLAGSVTQAVYVNLGSTSTVAKVSGVSFYVVNMVLSWVNTSFSRVEEIDAKTLQNLSRIQAQSIFARDVASLVERARGDRDIDIVCPSSKREHLESGRELMDRPPIIGAPLSPLQTEVTAPYSEIAEEKRERRASSCLSVDELLVPARKSDKKRSPQLVGRVLLPMEQKSSPDGNVVSELRSPAFTSTDEPTTKPDDDVVVVVRSDGGRPQKHGTDGILFTKV